jgi:hypothetical protein
MNRTFQHKGNEYEIRAVETESGWKAAVFCKGQRVSADTAISRETTHDLQLLTGRNGMEEHFEVIETDFKRDNP